MRNLSSGFKKPRKLSMTMGDRYEAEPVVRDEEPRGYLHSNYRHWLWLDRRTGQQN